MDDMYKSVLNKSMRKQYGKHVTLNSQVHQDALGSSGLFNKFDINQDSIANIGHGKNFILLAIFVTIVC